MKNQICVLMSVLLVVIGVVGCGGPSMAVMDPVAIDNPGDMPHPAEGFTIGLVVIGPSKRISQIRLSPKADESELLIQDGGAGGYFAALTGLKTNQEYVLNVRTSEGWAVAENGDIAFSVTFNGEMLTEVKPLGEGHGLVVSTDVLAINRSWKIQEIVEQHFPEEAAQIAETTGNGSGDEAMDFQSELLILQQLVRSSNDVIELYDLVIAFLQDKISEFAGTNKVYLYRRELQTWRDRRQAAVSERTSREEALQTFITENDLGDDAGDEPTDGDGADDSRDLPLPRIAPASDARQLQGTYHRVTEQFVRNVGGNWGDLSVYDGSMAFVIETGARMRTQLYVGDQVWVGEMILVGSNPSNRQLIFFRASVQDISE